MVRTLCLQPPKHGSRHQAACPAVRTSRLESCTGTGRFPNCRTLPRCDRPHHDFSTVLLSGLSDLTAGSPCESPSHFQGGWGSCPWRPNRCFAVEAPPSRSPSRRTTILVGSPVAVTPSGAPRDKGTSQSSWKTELNTNLFWCQNTFEIHS